MKTKRMHENARCVVRVRAAAIDFASRTHRGALPGRCRALLAESRPRAMRVSTTCTRSGRAAGRPPSPPPPRLCTSPTRTELSSPASAAARESQTACPTARATSLHAGTTQQATRPSLPCSARPARQTQPARSAGQAGRLVSGPHTACSLLRQAAPRLSLPLPLHQRLLRRRSPPRPPSLLAPLLRQPLL